MCRFLAYLGERPISMSDLLESPVNSLVSQSRHARETKNGLNADGFGIGWYSSHIDPKPGLYKSVQPAWNDENLKHLARKIESPCFVAHVRASTVGDVTILNCHPFSYKDYLFVHNGTIRQFDLIRRDLLSTLSDETFPIVNGQTDSQHFFALMMDHLRHISSPSVEDFKSSFKAALKTVLDINKSHKNDDPVRLNILLTNGREMIVTRYISDPKIPPLSLYYTIGSYMNNDSEKLMGGAQKKMIVVASEPLTDYVEEWKEVPANSVLTVDHQLNTCITPL